MATMQLANNYFPVMFFFLSFFLISLCFVVVVTVWYIVYDFVCWASVVGKNVSWEREWKKNDRNETRKALD